MGGEAGGGGLALGFASSEGKRFGSCNFEIHIFVNLYTFSAADLENKEVGLLATPLLPLPQPPSLPDQLVLFLVGTHQLALVWDSVEIVFHCFFQWLHQCCAQSGSPLDHELSQLQYLQALHWVLPVFIQIQYNRKVLWGIKC